MAKSKNHAETDSKFHWLFLSGGEAKTAIYDTKIVETTNFVVMPTKGSIVPGWVLVVPKFPVPRIADVPRELQSELADLVQCMLQEIECQFGKAYVFEHGGLFGSTVSCGVDQAHLHIVPLDFDLIGSAQRASPGGWIYGSSSRLPQEGLVDDEYWFVSSADTTAYKAIDKPCSQFFRKIIAKEAGLASSWDYKTHDFVENVEFTLGAVRVNV